MDYCFKSRMIPRGPLLSNHSVNSTRSSAYLLWYASVIIFHLVPVSQVEQFSSRMHTLTGRHTRAHTHTRPPTRTHTHTRAHANTIHLRETPQPSRSNASLSSTGRSSFMWTAYYYTNASQSTETTLKQIKENLVRVSADRALSGRLGGSAF